MLSEMKTDNAPGPPNASVGLIAASEELIKFC